MNIKALLTLTAVLASAAFTDAKKCKVRESPTPTVTSTPVPITTTTTPVTTTTTPITTTTAPPAPVTTTPAPITTTPAPVATTAVPVTTTPAPVPATTTPPPSASSPAASTSVSTSSTSTATIAKVMSFNLRTTQANDPCPSGCWEQRQHRVQKMLDNHKPDFIGTQETAPIQVAFMEKTLGYAGYGECAGPCDSNERNSIFYKSDQWTVIEGTTFALSDTPETIPSNTWNLEYLRAAVIARFKHNASGSTVCMLNTHYDISRGQEDSSALVAKRMAAFCKPEDMVAMTGDLNTVPNSKAIQYLEGQIVWKEGKTPIPLYETLTAAGQAGPTWIGQSFTNKVVDKKIDYIFARKDTHTCLQKGQIILDEFDGFTSSDHAVLMSTFCLGTSCSQCL